MATPRAFNPYRPAPEGASRSPCPALNSLANHSYIPHDGRSLPFIQLVNAIRTVYNTSLPLALLLAIAGFVLCGHFTGSWFSLRYELDLHDLARHGRIEHDASLGHADVLPGERYAPCVPDPGRIADMMNAGTVQLGPKGPVALSLTDFARVRLMRDRALIRPLDSIHALITRGEAALTILTLGEGQYRYVPREHLRQWFAEERLPVSWTGPQRQLTISEARKISDSLQQEVTRMSQIGTN